MEESAIRVFEWIPDTPDYSGAFHSLYEAFRINKNWSYFTLKQAREAVGKAISGKADDHFSRCLQGVFEKNKNRVSELIDYIDLRFDRSIIKEKFRKYEHICPMLTRPECSSKIIGHLLDPALESVVIVWIFEWDEALMDGINMVMDMDPLRRFTNLFDFFYKIEVMADRGESAVIVQIDFLFQGGIENSRMEFLEK